MRIWARLSGPGTLARARVEVSRSVIGTSGPVDGETARAARELPVAAGGAPPASHGGGVRLAVLYLPDVPGWNWLDAAVWARPVALRVVAAAQRAGIARVGIPAAWREPSLERWIRSDARLRDAVVWLDGLETADDAEWRWGPVL